VFNKKRRHTVTSLLIYIPPLGRNGIGVPLATSVRNSSTDCDDCRFIGTKEYSLESLGF
jgi:hypothetical protein